MGRCEECGKQTETKLIEINIPQFNIEEKFHLCKYCYNYWNVKLQHFTRELPSYKKYLGGIYE